MYLFILESIGTQELILVGIIALIVFGPRKLPEMARKFGSMLADFRRVSGDFRATWENAVNLEEDPKEPKKIEDEKPADDWFAEENNIKKEENHTVKSENSNGKTKLPEIRELSGEEFNNLTAEKTKVTDSSKTEKTDWL